MIVQDVLDIVAEQTRDQDNITWTVSDVVQYINEGVKNITMNMRKDSGITNYDCDFVDLMVNRVG